MKKLSLALMYLCLLAAFCCGISELLFVDKAPRPSEEENRMLSGFPALSAQSLLSGDFMDGIESYLSDAFFCRSGAAAFSDSLTGLFSVPDDSPDTGAIDEALLGDEPAAEAGQEETQSAALTEEAAAVETPAALRAEARDATFWLLDENGNKIPLMNFPAAQLQSFAAILDAYRAELPAWGTLHFANVPVSSVAHNITNRKQYVGWDTDTDEVLQGLVGEGVYIYDPTDFLDPASPDFYLYYYVEDHHWTPWGASLCADAFARGLGLAPITFEQYHLRIPGSGKGPYTIDQLRGQRWLPGLTEVIVPTSPAECCVISHMDQRKPGIFVTYEEKGYSCYYGGMRGPWRLAETGNCTGRRALVIGDSFSLPLAVFMAPYYDIVLSTDLRDSLYDIESSGADVATYIREYEIDDIFIVYSSYYPFCGDRVQGRLARHLHETGAES